MSSLTFDDWQKEFLNTEGDKILCTGRQVGKSVICAKDAGDYATRHKKEVILMIAPTERQAYALFDKTLDYLLTNFKSLIKRGKDRPTKTRIKLTNGTIIWCLPTGISGVGIRFLTVHRLYVDEASRVPEMVWDAVTPMLVTTGGDTILLSTPFGAIGYFYDCWINKDKAFSSFTRFAKNTEEVVRERKICETWTEKQRDKALQKIEIERSRMTKLAFSQEYMGKAMVGLKRFFSDELIQECCVLKRREVRRPKRDYFLGVDVARMGEDESTFEIIDRTNKVGLVHVENIITTKTRTTATTEKILELEDKYHFKRIYVDDAGVGAGVFDQLLIEEKTRRKSVAINNASKPLDRDETRKKKIIKEDLYDNLKRLMERREIQLLDDDEVIRSLRDIQFEYTDDGRLKISGDYSHIVEGLIRAAWCVKDKSLNIWIR